MNNPHEDAQGDPLTRRFVRVDENVSPSTPPAGGYVDGVTHAPGAGGIYFACPGLPVPVESGGSFSSGDDIATDSVGRAVAAGTGDTVVGVALEAATASGQVRYVRFGPSS